VKSFSDLTEQEFLALAISSEDDDARAYAGFAHSLMDTFRPPPRCSWKWPRKSTSIAAG
jgi:hypothetical protein